MKEQLISLEIAKLVKEKGFDFSKIEYRDSKTFLVVENVKARLKYFKNNLNANLIKRPTQTLIQKWLRDDNCIYIQTKQLSLSDTEFTIVDQCGKELSKPTIYMFYDGNKGGLELELQKALKLIKNEKGR